MDQETRWLTKYKEVMEFIERCHRNPSRHRIEEHDMLNWVKANRKRMNARELEEPQTHSTYEGRLSTSSCRAWRRD